GSCSGRRAGGIFREEYSSDLRRELPALSQRQVEGRGIGPDDGRGVSTRRRQRPRHQQGETRREPPAQGHWLRRRNEDAAVWQIERSWDRRPDRVGESWRAVAQPRPGGGFGKLAEEPERQIVH